MSEVVGHKEIGGMRFAVMSGPCKGCGATNYGISTSGPDYCGSCACGVPPELSQLRARLEKLNGEHIDALLALQIATGHKAEHMTPQMRERGEAVLAEFKKNGRLRSL